MRLVLAMLAIAIAGEAAADPIARSPVPTPRPDIAAASPIGIAATPERAPVAVAVTTARVAAASLARSPKPKPRPERAPAEVARYVAPEPARAQAAGPVGAVCRVEDIIGQRVDPIRGRVRGCGIADPVRIVRVGGVRLSRPATMDCQTARALRGWVVYGVKPTLERVGWEAARLEVAGGYACRTINNRPGGDISEHGRGRAIDISGITLTNGHTVTLSEGWNRRVEGQVLRRLHRHACGPFGTVLGPDADPYHEDHFHFDTKPRRAPYCR